MRSAIGPEGAAQRAIVSTLKYPGGGAAIRTIPALPVETGHDSASNRCIQQSKIGIFTLLTGTVTDRCKPCTAAVATCRTHRSGLLADQHPQLNG